MVKHGWNWTLLALVEFALSTSWTVKRIVLVVGECIVGNHFRWFACLLAVKMAIQMRSKLRGLRSIGRVQVMFADMIAAC